MAADLFRPTHPRVCVFCVRKYVVKCSSTSLTFKKTKKKQPISKVIKIRGVILMIIGNDEMRAVELNNLWEF